MAPRYYVIFSNASGAETGEMKKATKVAFEFDTRGAALQQSSNIFYQKLLMLTWELLTRIVLLLKTMLDFSSALPQLTESRTP